MKKITILSFCLFLLCNSLQAELPRVDYIYGAIERVYETKTGEWTAFVLVKDPLAKTFKCFVDSRQTLIKKGSQIISLSELSPGAKVMVLTRKDESGNLRASVIQIKNPITR